jgi:hypothetical protein
MVILTIEAKGPSVDRSLLLFRVNCPIFNQIILSGEYQKAIPALI